MPISNEVLLIFQALLGVIAWFVKRDLSEILREVKKTNGRVTRIEQQITDHDVLDRERFQQIEKSLGRIEDQKD